MDGSINNSHLFGDAKATAAVGGTQRKQRALQNAQALAEGAPTAENLRNYGAALFEMGLFSDAEQIFNMALKEHGEEIRLLVDLAFTLKNLNRTPEAIRTFLRAVELEPKSALARCAENEVWGLDTSYQPSWIRRSSPSAT